MKKLSIFLLLLVSLTSCTTDKTKDWHGIVGWTGLVDQQKLDASNRWSIDSSVDLYVVMPPQEILDDAFHAKLTALFRRYYPKARASIDRETLRQSLTSAKLAGMDYLVYPQVKQRIKQKGFDKVSSKEIALPELQRPALEMDILIYAVNNEKLLDHLQLVSKGGIFTSDETSLFWSPLNAYLRKLSQY